MEHRTYYYARVSTKEQNLDRQLAAFRSLGASEREIITDKESGKDLDRKGYQALKSTILRSGDTLIIKSLDRLSRNKQDIHNELQFFKDIQQRYELSRQNHFELNNPRKCNIDMWSVHLQQQWN